MAKVYRYAKAAPCTQAVIFARVSTKEQEPGASLDAQKAAMEDYCVKKGLKIVNKYRVIESSTNGKRVVFHEMLDFVHKQKNKTAIVVHCIDRFQRRFNECVEVETLLLDDKIDIHFCKEGLILTKNSSSADIMRWDMGILSGKMYVANLRDNVNRGMEYKWSNGEYQTKSPVGYLNIPKTKTTSANIILDPERAPLVKKMFEMYATGCYSIKSLQQFAKEMNLCSIRSKNHKPLGRETIWNTLKNPFYYGEMKIRGEIMPHKYEPIISKALFEQVQKVLSGKNTCVPTREYGGISFAFRKLIKCAECGGTISSEHHKGHVYLRCTHPRGNCNQKTVRESLILQQLDNEVFSKIRLNANIIDLLKKCVVKKMMEDSEANAVMKRQITNELNQLEAREQRVKDCFFNGDITRDEWNEEKANIASKREELQHTAEKYADISRDIQYTVNEVLDIAACASEIMKKATPEQQNNLLGLILKDCYLDGQKLVYTLNKPFDMLINLKNSDNWFKFDKSDALEYKRLASQVQMYKIKAEMNAAE